MSVAVNVTDWLNEFDLTSIDPAGGDAPGNDRGQS